jgi:hypothetical protein
VVSELEGFKKGKFPKTWLNLGGGRGGLIFNMAASKRAKLQNYHLNKQVQHLSKNTAFFFHITCRIGILFRIDLVKFPALGHKRNRLNHFLLQ